MGNDGSCIIDEIGITALSIGHFRSKLGQVGTLLNLLQNADHFPVLLDRCSIEHQQISGRLTDGRIGNITFTLHRFGEISAISQILRLTVCTCGITIDINIRHTLVADSFDFFS